MTRVSFLNLRSLRLTLRLTSVEKIVMIYMPNLEILSLGIVFQK